MHRIAPVGCLLLLALVPGCALFDPKPASDAGKRDSTATPPELVADRPKPPTAQERPVVEESDPALAFAKRMGAARRAAPEATEPIDPAGENEPITEAGSDPLEPAPTREPGGVAAPPNAAPAARAAESRGGAAPTLSSVEVRVQQPNVPLAAAKGVRGGGANVPAAVVDVPPDLREFVARWSQQRGQDGGFQTQLDARLLQALAGEYEQARRPLEAVSDAQQTMARQLVETVIAIRDGHGGDPGLEARRVLERVNELQRALIPASDLSLPTLVICRSVLGYGLYEPIEPAEFRSGAQGEFVAYCEIQNLATQKQSDGTFQTWLDVKTSLLSRSGDLVQESQAPSVKTNWKSQRHECFLAPIVSLPPNLPAGEYVLKITITDRIGGKVAEKRVALRITASG